MPTRHATIAGSVNAALYGSADSYDAVIKYCKEHDITDIHSLVASVMFDTDDVTPTMRIRAKTVTFMARWGISTTDMGEIMKKSMQDAAAVALGKALERFRFHTDRYAKLGIVPRAIRLGLDEAKKAGLDADGTGFVVHSLVEAALEEGGGAAFHARNVWVNIAKEEQDAVLKHMVNKHYEAKRAHEAQIALAEAAGESGKASEKFEEVESAVRLAAAFEREARAFVAAFHVLMHATPTRSQ